MKKIYYGWWLVVITMVTHCISIGAILFSYSLIGVPLSQELGASRFEMSLGYVGVLVASAVIAPLLGKNLDRVSMRWAMMLGVVAQALGFFALSITTSMWQVPIVYALGMSLSQCLLGPLATGTLLARWFSRRRGLALGISAMGLALGGMLMPPIVQWFIVESGWRSACQMLSVVTVVITAPLILLFVFDRPADKGMHPDGDLQALPQESLTEDQRFASTRAVLKNRNFWLVAFLVGTSYGIGNGIISNQMPILIEAGVPKTYVALVISFLALPGLVGKLVFGMVVDKCRLRSSFAVNLALTAAHLVLFLFALSHPDLWIVLFAGIIMGITNGGIVPVWGAAVAKLFGPNNYGRVMGLMNTAMLPFMAGGPALFGKIYDVAHDYRLAFALFLALALAAALLMPGRLREGQ